MQIILAVMLATAAPVVHDKPSRAQGVTVPMGNSSWEAMTSKQRDRYARVTVEALRLNPRFSSCQWMTEKAMRNAIDVFHKEGEPLMMTITIAAIGLCPAGDLAKP